MHLIESLGLLLKSAVVGSGPQDLRKRAQSGYDRILRENRSDSWPTQSQFRAKAMSPYETLPARAKINNLITRVAVVVGAAIPVYCDRLIFGHDITMASVGVGILGIYQILVMWKEGVTIARLQKPNVTIEPVGPDPRLLM
jgi:hypothetical protein